MKHQAWIAAALAAALTAACDVRAPKHYDYEPPGELAEERDSTVFGFCGAASTPRMLQLITSTDDTIYFDVEQAAKKGRVMAGYSRGDEIYVLPDSSHKRALLTINKNNLLGEWVMPSPYDGSSPAGIVIKDGGEAESFGQQGDIIYKAWRIMNGKMQIVETRDDGTDIYYTQTYTIVKMTRDSLYLRNEEESFEYGRYKPEPYVDLGIEFEEDDSDNYGIY